MCKGTVVLVEMCHTNLKAPLLFLRYNPDRKRKGIFYMIQNIVKQEVMIYIMAAVAIFGVCAKIVAVVSLRRMVRAAREIQKSQHKLMKLVKAKFEHASLITDRVQNVNAFVDKYLYEYKALGIRLTRWQFFFKASFGMVLLAGSFSMFESVRMEGVGELLLHYVQWTGLLVVLLTLLCFVSDEKGNLQVSRNYMVEYLENVCISRYAKKHAEEKQKENIGEEKEEEKEEKEEETPSVSEQELHIRAILEEFLA